jgi:hypothetical protein
MSLDQFNEQKAALIQATERAKAGIARILDGEPSPQREGDVVPAPVASRGSLTWPNLIPLDIPTFQTLPDDVLPSWLNAMVNAVAVHTETPRELAAMLGLAVLGAACQKTFVVQPEVGYTEPLNIWTIVALEPGNRKTSVMQAMTRPLMEKEREQCEIAKVEITRNESERETMRARVQVLRAKAAKDDFEHSEDIRKDIHRLEAMMPEVSALPRLWAQDITPEKLGQVMAENGERLALLSDEGGIFEILAGRYNGGIPNLDIFLQSHIGAPVRVDRGSRPAIIMQHPALTIGLSPQPEVLQGLKDKPGFRGRGLLGRFLYALPTSRLGYRTLKTEPVPLSVENDYRTGIAALVDHQPAVDESGNIRAYILRFSEPAYQEWKEFARKVEIEMRVGGRFEYIRDWAGKLPGAAARIAGLFHCAQEATRQPWNKDIDVETMKMALTLTAILIDHALAVFDLMGADAGLDGARKVWAYVERCRHGRFTARDCFQKLRGTFRRMQQLEPAFDVLVERGYLMETDSERNGPGRPSRTFVVNPQAMEAWPT